MYELDDYSCSKCGNSSESCFCEYSNFIDNWNYLGLPYDEDYDPFVEKLKENDPICYLNGLPIYKYEDKLYYDDGREYIPNI